MSTFFPPRVVILVVVQSNVPLRTCFWPLYWTSSLCRCELMPVLLWNFYTGHMQIVMFQSVLFWNLLSEPFEVILLTNYKVFVFTNYLIFNAFSVPLFKMNNQLYSIVKDSNADLTVGNWNFKILPKSLIHLVNSLGLF